MRTKPCFWLLAALALAGTGAQAQTSSREAPAPPRQIKASGCTQAGVESSCVVLEDFKDKKLYNLFFPAGKQAGPGVAISFTGAEHQGMTTCMQGTAVDVIQWKRLKKSCPKEP